MLGGRWETLMARDGYAYPFALVADELRRGDVTLANLEAPLTRRGNEFSAKKYRFRADPVAAAALRASGITTVTLANNHSMDFGPVGLVDTLAALRQAGIEWIGAGENLSAARRMVVHQIRGQKVALVGYSLVFPTEFWATDQRAGAMPVREALLRADIAAARRLADIVIVTVHWGEEGVTRLRPYQPRLAHMMIDAGADAVIGHHPHVVQGVERYRRGIIFYSLGNFVFASKGRAADHGLLIRLRFDGEQRSAELVPLNILHRQVGFQPTLISGKQADQVIERLRGLPPGRLEAHKEDGRYLIRF